MLQEESKAYWGVWEFMAASLTSRHSSTSFALCQPIANLKITSYSLWRYGSVCSTYRWAACSHCNADPCWHIPMTCAYKNTSLTHTKTESLRNSLITLPVANWAHFSNRTHLSNPPISTYPGTCAVMFVSESSCRQFSPFLPLPTRTYSAKLDTTSSIHLVANETTEFLDLDHCQF